ncbi:Predicted arabinose efflux permease, MFS family [Micromonospora phaseoli]|uniref:Predicted arabinose efflux permease, MFS family n=1 Tax=Micromonospora phaseoli TaxID=1144548 RepID=A0A1H6Y7C8_9ACTN|nr:MFS transporter [Micromonospora phaseoli]PZW00065.1 putative MFS family arabinose efflux permease [Micromonospora phaseoli]SEJ37161.1 Predicted arabinose efflux permease, MFS family [Micromonospora phaseoli]
MRRNAVLFVAVSLLAGFGGSAMALVAGIWLLDLTGSPGLAALAGLCVYAPTLAGPWLGILVDRLPRRPLVIATNLTLTATLPTLLAVRSPAQAWLLLCVSTVYGVAYVLVDAGESALLPAALSPADLRHVNGARASAQEGVKLVAPLAGAGLYAWQGGHVVALLAAVLPALAAVGYAALRLTRRPPAAHRPRGVRAGFAVLSGAASIRVPVGLAAVTIGMSGFTTAAGYAVVTDVLGRPATVLGVLLSAQGAGSLVGGLIVGRLLARYPPTAVGVAGTVLFAASCLIRCLPWWPGVVAASVVAGVGLPWALVAAVTAVQTHSPDALLGRVAATANTIMFGPIVVTTAVGSAAVLLGARPPLALAATVCLIAGALGGRLATASRSAPRHPARGSRRSGRPARPGPSDASSGSGHPRPSRTSSSRRSAP